MRGLAAGPISGVNASEIILGWGRFTLCNAFVNRVEGERTGKVEQRAPVPKSFYVPQGRPFGRL
jgi:hypothetical protein